MKRLGLRELKWLAFAVAAAGVTALNLALFLANHGAHPAEALARAVVLVLASLAFNEYAFGLVSRRDALLAEERERLYALHQISRGVAHLPAVERNLTWSLEVLRGVTGADIAAWIEAADGGGAVCRAAAGDTLARLAGLHLPVSAADFLWRSIGCGRSLVVENAARVARPADLPLLQSEGLTALAAVGAGGPAPLGAVVVGWRQAHVLTRADREFVENVASLLGVAVQNLQLYRQTQRMGALEERERIAAEMHDGLAQALTYLKLKAEAALAQSRAGSAPVLESALRAIRNGAVEALGDVRQTLMDLKAPDRAEAGDFVASLTHQVRAWSQFNDIAAEVLPPTEPVHMTAESEGQVLRIVQEALANVRKHAEAKRVTVRVGHEGGGLVVAVADDGRGFDVRHCPETGHYGLGILRDRAAAIGGVLHIDSHRDCGTEVVLYLPDGSGPVERAGVAVAASAGGRT